MFEFASLSGYRYNNNINKHIQENTVYFTMNNDYILYNACSLI